MKKLILIAFLILPIYKVTAQNLLGFSRNSIIKLKTDSGAYFDGEKYATDGSKYLQFSYNINQVLKKDILTEVYYLNDSSICDSYRLVYKTRRELDNVVNQVKLMPSLKKVDGKFEWIDIEDKFIVKITLDTNDDGFEVIVVHPKDKN